MAAGAASSVAFVPGATKLLLFCSPCAPGSVLLYNWALGSALRSFQLPLPVSCLAASPDGALLAFGLAHGEVVVADAQGEASCSLTGHTASVQALAFAEDGESLVSAAGSTMYVWKRDALHRHWQRQQQREQARLQQLQL